MNNKTALWVGRFQPTHLGHLDGAKQIQEQGIEKLIIGIGSAQEKNTLKNPFTFQERKEMLKLGLNKTLNIDYEIVPIPDMPTDKQWLSYIQNLFPGKSEGKWEDKKVGKRYLFETVFSGNPWVQNCFEKDVEVKSLNENRVSISASNLRSKLGNFEEILEETTQEISNYLDSISAGERIQKLIPKPRNPYLATDGIVEYRGGIVLIERLNEPFGYALPGGFVDYGESGEHAVVREMREELGLDFKIKKQLGFYSDPTRDPRNHVASVVYIGEGQGNLGAYDDAKSSIIVSPEDALKLDLVFDHRKIVEDYLKLK